jgi:hypothetical protein
MCDSERAKRVRSPVKATSAQGNTPPQKDLVAAAETEGWEEQPVKRRGANFAFTCVCANAIVPLRTADLIKNFKTTL